jgi:hypothetical protein
MKNKKLEQQIKRWTVGTSTQEYLLTIFYRILGMKRKTVNAFIIGELRWVQGAVSFEVKRQKREANESTPSSAEVKNGGSISTCPHYVFMAWCPINYTRKE